MPDINWLAWASRLNQASLLPFLAFLWILSRIPDAPRKAVRGWFVYLVFIAVAIPAGIYSKARLGTSMANVDWLHGPCEALLSLANLLIVLGLRDALRAATAAHQPDLESAAEAAAAVMGTGITGSNACGSGSERVSHRHAPEDPLSDMHYMQQLREVYSEQHTMGAAATAAASRAGVVGAGHMQGFGAAAVKVDDAGLAASAATDAVGEAGRKSSALRACRCAPGQHRMHTVHGSISRQHTVVRNVARPAAALRLSCFHQGVSVHAAALGRSAAMALAAV